MINYKTNRHVVVDSDGHIVEIPRDPKAPGYATRSDLPKLKSGWRLADEGDLKKAAEIEAKRAAKEAAEAEAALKATKAAQDKSDAAEAKVGGPLKDKA
jgi:hypothetical protein